MRNGKILSVLCVTGVIVAGCFFDSEEKKPEPDMRNDHDSALIGKWLFETEVDSMDGGVHTEEKCFGYTCLKIFSPYRTFHDSIFLDTVHRIDCDQFWNNCDTSLVAPVAFGYRVYGDGDSLQYDGKLPFGIRIH